MTVSTYLDGKTQRGNYAGFSTLIAKALHARHRQRGAIRHLYYDMQIFQLSPTTYMPDHIVLEAFGGARCSAEEVAIDCSSRHDCVLIPGRLPSITVHSAGLQLHTLTCSTTRMR
jgi:hypothetical protein